MLVVYGENEVEAAWRHCQDFLGREVVGGFEIAVVEIVIRGSGDRREFDGTVAGLRFWRDVYVPAGVVAFGRYVEAELEIVSDVVDVGFASLDFAVENQIRVGDGGLGGFWFVVKLSRGGGEGDEEGDSEGCGDWRHG